MPAAEVVDQVNEWDQWIGTIARADIFRLHANFRVAHVFIFNPQGDLLLQEIGAVRTRHPGRWGSSVAGYVAAGEDYAEAARRRLWEELGVPDTSLQKIGKTQMVDEGCRKFITLFEGRHNGPFILDSSHIAKLEFVSLEQVLKMAAQSPLLFTPTFLRLLDFYKGTRPS